MGASWHGGHGRLHALIVYVPVLQTVFRTAPLPLEWWPIILLGLFPGFIGTEIDKALRGRGRAGVVTAMAREADREAR